MMFLWEAMRAALGERPPLRLSQFARERWDICSHWIDVLDYCGGDTSLCFQELADTRSRIGIYDLQAPAAASWWSL